MASTWKLVNLEGDNSPLQTRVDIDIDESGRPAELTLDAALDQRVRFGLVARRGRRKLSKKFGTLVWDRLSNKSLAGKTGAMLSSDVQQFVRDLKDMQTDAQARLTLKPIELIDKVVQLTVDEINYGYYRLSIELKTQQKTLTVETEII